MNNELLTVLEYLEQERGISRDVLIEAIEKALMSAGRKSIHPANDLKVKINSKTGEIKAWAVLEVVDDVPTQDEILFSKAQEKYPDVEIGDFVEWEVTPSNFGRIAAQTARQAIVQHLRKAEKNIVRDEYQEHVGEILNGTVKRFDAGNLIIDLPKAEGVISSKDRIRGEQFLVGERINAILLRVDTLSSGPSLILSRSNPDFVKALFAREVAEIRDGIVEIKAISRDAGNRTKIAVGSKDSNVDPVGACVGVSGRRVKNVTNELGGDSGERIDIIPWTADIRQVAKEALKPADVIRVEYAADNDGLDVYLTEEESRKAYGRKAINLKLAQRLVGRQINLVVEEGEAKEETFEIKQAKAVSALANELGIAREIADKVVKGGFLSVEQLREAETQDIEAIENLKDDEVDIVLDALDELDEVGSPDAQS